MPLKKKKETAGELAPAPTGYDAILDHMQSAFSKDLIKKGADEKPYNGVGLSWGIPSLNYICTKNPFIGIVPGRIYEIFGQESSGKTTLSLHAIAEALKVHGVAAFIDAEHALDPVYAKNLGVDMSKLIITQPDYGEQALDIAEAFVRQGTPLIVIDSVAALVPKAELDASNDKNHMGLQARMMSQALRKLTAITSKSHSTIIFINQTRMKIGVMFGCFHYNTLINFDDGRSLPIGQVVDEKIKGNVYCMNEITRCIESKPITDWHDNGTVDVNEDFISIQTKSINGGGRFGLTCTKNHKILTDQGWLEAEKITYHHKLISKFQRIINNSLEEFLNGTIIGDTHISVRHSNTASLRLQDSVNTKYLKWKVDQLRPYFKFNEYVIRKNRNLTVRYDSEYNYELSKIKHKLGNRDPMYMLNKYTDLSMAIWIMDDGHYDNTNSHSRYILSIKRFKNNEKKLIEISSKLKQLGFNNSFNLLNGSFSFDTFSTNIIAEKICKYIPDCMQYKLPEQFRGKYEPLILDNNPVFEIDLVNISEIRFASNRQMRNKRKFDISVKDNHNYMVGGVNNGVIVHNSPETTTGGNALKFYASVRLDVHSSIAKDKAIVGNYKNLTGKQDAARLGTEMTIKAVKTKLTSPFQDTKLDILYGLGVDKNKDLFNFAVSNDLIERGRGAYKVKQGSKELRILDSEIDNHTDLIWELLKSKYK